MSLKITVELDGHTEQELMPVIRQVAKRHPELFGSELPAPVEGRYVENSALLQQQIQQLMVQNRLLQAQLADAQKVLPPAPGAKALPPGVAPSTQPTLPARYRTKRREGEQSLARRARRAASQLTSRSWRLLVWLCLGKEWLLIFLLLTGAMLGGRALVPKLSELLLAPEFTESTDGGPGQTVSPEEDSEERAEQRAEHSATDGKAPQTTQPTTQPTNPASKAGSHPPPPPAFQ